MPRRVNPLEVEPPVGSDVSISMSEVLWGGPRGAGLVHTVARLAESVESLGNTVANLAGKVTGEDGLGTQMTVVQTDIQRINARLDSAVKWTLIFLGTIITPMAGGMAWLVGRSIEIAVKGHV